MFEVLPNWHPIFVHFTIALYATAAAFYALSTMAFNRPWAAGLLVAARSNLWAGAALSILTVVAGVRAFLTVAHDAPQEFLIVDHRRWAIATATIWWLIAAWEARRAVKKRQLSPIVTLVLVLALVPLIITGWKGGELVYRSGIGVIAAGGSPR